MAANKAAKDEERQATKDEETQDEERRAAKDEEKRAANQAAQEERRAANQAAKDEERRAANQAAKDEEGRAANKAKVEERRAKQVRKLASRKTTLEDVERPGLKENGRSNEKGTSFGRHKARPTVSHQHAAKERAKRTAANTAKRKERRARPVSESAAHKGKLEQGERAAFKPKDGSSQKATPFGQDKGEL